MFVHVPSYRISFSPLRKTPAKRKFSPSLLAFHGYVLLNLIFYLTHPVIILVFCFWFLYLYLQISACSLTIRHISSNCSSISFTSLNCVRARTSLWLSRCNQEKKGKAQSRRNRRLCQEMFVEWQEL